MTWLSLVLGLVKLAGALASWLHDRQMIDAGQAEQLVKTMTEQSNALAKALKARNDLAANLDRGGASVMQRDSESRD